MVIPLDAIGLAHDTSPLVNGKLTAKIAQQPRAQLLGLAHVHDFAIRREHAVDAGPILRAGLHGVAHARELGRRRGRPHEPYL